MSDVTDEMARRALEVLWEEDLVVKHPDELDEKAVESMKKALVDALLYYKETLQDTPERKSTWRERHGLYDDEGSGS